MSQFIFIGFIQLLGFVFQTAVSNLRVLTRTNCTAQAETAESADRGASIGCFIFMEALSSALLSCGKKAPAFFLSP
jgi:hypothetical protein